MTKTTKPHAEVVIDETDGSQPTEYGFAIDLMAGTGVHASFVGFPEGGKFTTALEVDQVGPDGTEVDYPIVHVYTDYAIGTDASEYDSLVSMLKDIVKGLDHPAAREAYLGGLARRTEADIQATGPEGETVDGDAS